MTPIHLAPRERNTILAALRLWQLSLAGLVDPPVEAQSSLAAIATDGGEEDALDVESIDELCERINS